MTESDWFVVNASRQSADGTPSVYLYLAHQRWRDPKIALLTRVESAPLPDGSMRLQLRLGATLDQLTVYALVRELLNGQAGGFDFDVDKFSVTNFDMFKDEELCNIRRVKTVIGNTMHFQVHNALQENQRVKKPKAPDKDEPTEADKAFQSNQRSDPRRDKPPSSAGFKPVVDKCVAKAIREAKAAAVVDAFVIDNVSEGSSSDTAQEDLSDHEAKLDLVKVVKGAGLDDIAPAPLATVKAAAKPAPVVSESINPSSSSKLAAKLAPKAKAKAKPTYIEGDVVPLDQLPDFCMVRELMACPFRDEMPITPPLSPRGKSDKGADHIQLGQWWMTRTGRVAHCKCCKGEIAKYEYRAIYHPAPKVEYAHRPPSYTDMHNRIKRDYFHIRHDCLPRPSGGVEEVCDRDNIWVEVDFLPKEFKETVPNRIRKTADALNTLCLAFNTCGHRVT